MIRGPVAVHALEVVTAHVHVKIFVRVKQAFIQVTVFDGVTATASEVASATILPRRQSHAPGRGQQVDSFCRKTLFTLGVTTALVMANQAVDVIGFFEVECLVFPAVARVTGRAAGPVALDSDAEIVDGVFFAGGDRFVPALHHDRFGLPAPVRRMNHLLRRFFVAGQAGARDILARFKRAFHQRRVIDRSGPFGYMVPGRIDNLPFNR